MLIFGEYDYAAKEEDLLPFFSQLKTRDKQYVLLPHGGHALMLEKDHRRFQHEVLGFFDRPERGPPAGLPADRRQRLPKVDLSIDHDEVTWRFLCRKTLQRRISPGVLE
jgi:hypothetical protein